MSFTCLIISPMKNQLISRIIHRRKFRRVEREISLAKSSCIIGRSTAGNNSHIIQSLEKLGRFAFAFFM